jgi:recombination protein RecT
MESKAIELSRPVSNTGTLKVLLERSREAMLAILPKHITPDRMIKTVLLAASKQPKILECTAESAMRAFMTASELGLDVSGTLGDAYLVPYKNTLQLIPGYRGLQRLAYQTGEVENIYAYNVYANEQFKVHGGTENRIEHDIKMDCDRSDENITAVYAVAKMKTGGVVFVALSRQEVEKVRRSSKAGESGPWMSWFGEMSKKTAIRRLCKMLPLATETPLAKSLQHEDEIEGGVMVDAVDALVNAPPMLEQAVESRPLDDDQIKQAKDAQAVLDAKRQGTVFGKPKGSEMSDEEKARIIAEETADAERTAKAKFGK